MYLISGTLFFIASFFIFISNIVLAHLYFNQINGYILFFALISLFMGFSFYYIHFYEDNRKK